ncbi:hypothetical protein Cob_v000735 [Colletotrichum orbiculare MAFF 240422]|uniref:Uncharacterized protein n=1 Tax=Colletotrichum orbiculare (strain 104-T / ATCC 96160 / CBS 514.97 / LARS 414 / MAFF 240422) TaxID=1213857 RepID=A0A484G671_COLOR|nr:hypothetical protein Cob_v000735 [Colletotrichum orbiculare MAFF 240422]
MLATGAVFSSSQRIQCMHIRLRLRPDRGGQPESKVVDHSQGDGSSSLWKAAILRSQQTSKKSIRISTTHQDVSLFPVTYRACTAVFQARLLQIFGYITPSQDKVFRPTSRISAK